MGDTELMRARSWRWLRTRIVGCLSDPETRTARWYQSTLPKPDPRSEVDRWR